MTYLEFLRYITDEERPKNWRRGQFVFNMLYRARPEIANKIRGSDIDPFYKDDRISAALAYAEEQWDPEVAPKNPIFG